MSVKISVIIPVYNMEKYLRGCLQSVISQSLENIEIICINDGSTDESLNILQEYKDKDDRIIIVDQNNTGVGKARNNGISLAKGEFIAFMDPDDYYPSNDVLQILYNKANEQNVLVCGGSFCEDHNGVIKSNYPPHLAKYIFKEEKLIEYKDFQFEYGYIRFIYHTKMLIDNDIYFPEYSRFQDPPFYVKAMIHAKVFYAVPIFAYCYRWGHKKINWNKKRTNDMVKGLIDNLQMSKESCFAILHATTVKRFNVDYLAPIMNNLNVSNLELLSLLLKANDLVDVSLLREENSDVPDKYVIEPLRIVFSNEITEVKSELANVEKQLSDVYNSVSFKIGRIITFVPRKIKNILNKILVNIEKR